ncbi:hypothetical protein ACJ51O_36980 (plasmid) [Burkholderia pyrrocinia]|uniref:hypothetical protein n=1 Tax=Burkholderia pyrrocinia TaxID=60550 RepID=UPI0038B4853C
MFELAPKAVPEEQTDSPAHPAEAFRRTDDGIGCLFENVTLHNRDILAPPQMQRATHQTTAH